MMDFDKKAAVLIRGGKYEDAQLKLIEIAAALKAAYNEGLEDAATVFTEQRDWDMRAEVLAKKVPT